MRQTGDGGGGGVTPRWKVRSWWERAVTAARLEIAGWISSGTAETGTAAQPNMNNDDIVSEASLSITRVLEAVEIRETNTIFILLSLWCA